MDSWFVSQPLRQRLHDLGFTKIIIAGKSNYTEASKIEYLRWIFLARNLALSLPTTSIDSL